MRKQLVVAVLVVVVLVAGITTGTAFVARAFANALSGSGGAPKGNSEVAPTPGGATSSSPSPYQPFTPSFIVHKLQPGEQLITDAQINDYFLAQAPSITGDLANTMLMIHEGQIEVRCMAQKGWWYDPRYTGGPTGSSTPEGLALNGNTGAGDAYRWQDAGCYGLAVHQTGATS